jgi:two-component system sensor histidine kinase VicK
MRVGIRWWLALAFAAVAATTAIAVAQLSSARSEVAFRQRAQSLAAGNTFEAAIDLRDRPLRRIANDRRLALFLFDASGRLVSAPRSRGVPVARLGHREEAVAAALDGRRYVATDASVGATTVALPIASEDARALVAYASHPELAAELGIVHDEITRAAWIALLVGGIVGAGIATLIALRLRRIARAAATIESGDLGTRLHSDFPDELGDLADTFDRMRNRLRETFRQLEADRDRLGQLLERLTEGVIAVDEQLTVQFCNRAARAIVPGLEPEEPLPEPWQAASLRGFAAMLFTSEVAHERRIEPDEERVYLLAGVPATPGDTAVLVVRDLTDDERRERAEREFVANASHELRTPLTTILGAIEVLQAGAKENERERDRFLAHIEREAERLVRLTRALLILARAQTREERAHLTEVELKPLLEHIASSVHARPGVGVSVVCDENVSAAAEPDLLEQAITNLAANAVEHTQRGEIVLAAGANNGRVRIEVRDSGPGIPASIRRRIFERFYRPLRTSGAGFGLGLAIVRETVRAQDGTIDVGSAPEGGTCVSIELARAEP